MPSILKGEGICKGLLTWDFCSAIAAASGRHGTLQRMNKVWLKEGSCNSFPDCGKCTCVYSSQQPDAQIHSMQCYSSLRSRGSKCLLLSPAKQGNVAFRETQGRVAAFWQEPCQSLGDRPRDEARKHA